MCPVNWASTPSATRELQPLSSSGAATGVPAGLAPPRPLPSSLHSSPPPTPGLTSRQQETMNGGWGERPIAS